MASNSLTVVVVRKPLARAAWATLALVLAGVFAYEWVAYGPQVWREGAFVLAIVTATWLLWAAPSMTLAPERVHVRNAFFCHDLGWGSLAATRIDFGLVLEPGGRAIRVSAAPAGQPLLVPLLKPRPSSELPLYMGTKIRTRGQAAAIQRLLTDYREVLEREGVAFTSAHTRRPHAVSWVLLAATLVWALAALVF